MTLDPLRWAKYYATIKHADQKYGGNLPYTHHLAAVEAVLRRFGIVNEDYLNAAWLHDVVEDTGTKIKEIRELFGETVADLVWAVTNEPGANRKARHATTYPKIRQHGYAATTLKLADRIANVEAGGSLVKMYKKEYEDFRRALYPMDSGLLQSHYWNKASLARAMWDHLDKLMEYK